MSVIRRVQQSDEVTSALWDTTHLFVSEVTSALWDTTHPHPTCWWRDGGKMVVMTRHAVRHCARCGAASGGAGAEWQLSPRCWMETFHNLPAISSPAHGWSFIKEKRKHTSYKVIFYFQSSFSSLNLVFNQNQ